MPRRPSLTPDDDERVKSQIAGMASATLPGSDYDSSDDESLAPNGCGETAMDLDEPSVEETVTYVGGSPSGDSTGSDKVPKMASRAYQLEMLDQSLRQNVIVSMDTGSGKTQVAILRIKAELEKGGDKIIWFLAPTVELCAQQFDAIELQIQSVSMKLITGRDNVDSWSEKTWAPILATTRLVVSTYQVLEDALSHAFLTMEQLALIVFDEAHNCVNKAAGRKIMTDFYHRSRAQGLAPPSILGLTASPSMRSTSREVEDLEATLDAKCVSPTRHRSELVNFTNRPQVSYVLYDPAPRPVPQCILDLEALWRGLDITEDPWLISLAKNPTDRNKRAMTKAIIKYDTWTQGQIKGLVIRSRSIAENVGPWAAERYLHMAVMRCLERAGQRDDQIENVNKEVELYLAGVLRQLILPPSSEPTLGGMSDKMQQLIDQLLASPSSTGIIFVKERAAVSIVQELLQQYPPTRDIHRVGAIVGGSIHAHRARDIFDLPPGRDVLALHKFRTNKINLLVATSVLEEGIDVPACDLVICFDQPGTPKAFIQRRGRARMKKSRLLLFIDQTAVKKLREWAHLEEEMRLLLQDEERQFQQLELLEESDELASQRFIVPETGARLDFENAKSHLEHFCAVLSRTEFVNNSPDYIIHDHGQLRATVLLPSFVPEHLRAIDSAGAWPSEKNATKDAAFQAYKALYDAGLVSTHLLPLKPSDLLGVEKRDAHASVQQALRPWERIVEAWRGPDRWRYGVSMSQMGQVREDYELVLPIDLGLPRPLKMYVDRDDVREVWFNRGSAVPASEAAWLPDHTSTLLALHFSHKWVVEQKAHVVQAIVKGETVSMDLLGMQRPDLLEPRMLSQYLIRGLSREPYVFRGLIATKPALEEVQKGFTDYDAGPDEPYLHLTRWTKRTDFLHPIQSTLEEKPSKHTYSRVLPISWAVADAIPGKHAHFGMLLPSIIHSLETTLVAQDLASSILAPLQLTSLDLVVQAICAPAASEAVNYEGLEFIGDSILKFSATAQMAADHPVWPEGYLSMARDRIVSNSRLSRAAQETGLSRYILTKPFTGHKWRPLYLDSVHAAPESKRTLSTKTLADVVEALIGASFKDGGAAKALRCMALFIREVPWRTVDLNRDLICSATPDGQVLPSDYQPLEDLLGYSFTKKGLLLEAMTHASYVVDVNTRSLERLEYIGDGVLDYIIVSRLAAQDPAPPHGRMHMLKTAMVNSDFLAFIVLESAVPTKESAVVDSQAIEVHGRRPLWKFMRYALNTLGAEMAATAARYEAVREEILAAIDSGTHYPWATLARIQAKKFFSDLFESLLGAVWVDSGSLDTCAALVRRLGILPYLDRLLNDDVHVQHPKEELGKLADREQVTYNITSLEGPGGDKEWRCRILVGAREVVDVGGGVDKEEVKTKAASAAVGIITSERLAR